MEPIETERLVLRGFEMSDVDATHRQIYSSSEVWGPRSRSGVESAVAMAMYMAASPDDVPWTKRAVVLKDKGELIGSVRLSPSPNSFYRWEEEPDPPYNPVEVELAFAFGKDYWGKGYAYEASLAMIDYAFNRLRLPRLVNGTGGDNLRSIALHQRLGFRMFSALPNGDGIVAVLDNPN